jgi:type IV pilus assembly protein PilB
VDFQKVAVSPEARKAIDVRTADKYNVMPVAYKEELGKKIVVLAMSDPTNLDAVTEIQFQTGLTVKPVVATESSITRAIDHYYRNRPLRESSKAVRAEAAEWDDEMIILQHGEETHVGELDGVDVSELVRALVRVLEEKGVISAQELQEALRRR